MMADRGSRRYDEAFEALSAALSERAASFAYGDAQSKMDQAVAEAVVAMVNGLAEEAVKPVVVQGRGWEDRLRHLRDVASLCEQVLVTAVAEEAGLDVESTRLDDVRTMARTVQNTVVEVLEDAISATEPSAPAPAM